MPIDPRDDVPTIGSKTGRRVISKPTLYLAINGNTVVIIKGDQFAQAQRSSLGTGFMGNPLHQATIAQKHIGMVINHGMSWLIKLGCQDFFRQGHTYCVRQALAQRARRSLHTWGVAIFRVPRRLTVHLAKILYLGNG